MLARGNSTSAAVRTDRDGANERFEQVEEVDAALYLCGIAAVAFQRTVDRSDRAAKAPIVDDATMRGLSVRTALRHPVPQGGSPGDRRILLHLVRICPQVKPERLTRTAVVEVPAQLDWTTAIITLPRGTNAAGRRAVGTIEAASDFSDVNQPARFVREVRERRGGFAPAHRQVSRSREGRKGCSRRHKALVGIEWIAIREHLVELRLTDNRCESAARIRIGSRWRAGTDRLPGTICG